MNTRLLTALFFLFFIATAASAQTAPPPVIDSLSTAQGPREGGTRLVIRGRNLVGPNPVPCPPGCNPTRVTIGDREAIVLSSSDEAIVVVTQATAEGRYDVVVTRADGQTATRRSFEFVDYLQPERRVLLPVVIIGEAPGALGSRWVTEIAGRNESDERVAISQTLGPCALLFCAPVYGEPRSTFRPGFRIGQPSGAGAFLSIEDKPAAANVSFSLRIRDVSREAEGWGTELPVVREHELYTSASPLQLLDIPLDPRYRNMLRLYDADGPSDMKLLVEVLRNDGDEVRASRVIQFPGGEVTFASAGVPGYVQIGFAELLPPGLPASERVRLRISTTEHWRRFWAFVTVTNNATQQVTAITPQPVP